MLLEYLVNSEQDSEKCISIIEEMEATLDKKKVDTDTYIVSAFIKSNAESSAIKLSNIHEKIVSAVNCTILTDESSAYHDQSLYPIINKFERKLRKLLYCASVITGKDNSQIKGLESKDFGELFTLLFRDDVYWKNVKSFVNDSKKGQIVGWQGFAGELKRFLESEKEKPLWDKLLPDKVPTLRGHFSEVQRSRNDVMHAHYINRKDYTQIKRLFEQINSELDDAIEGLANGAFIPNTYNEDLSNAITYFTTHDGDYITDNDGNPIVFR